MKKYILPALSLLVALSGCVSTKQYEAALDESKLKGVEIEKLSTENKDLSLQNETLTREVEGLTLELDTKNNAFNDLRKELDSISGEKKTVAKTLFDAKERISELEKQNDYLDKENARLMTKAGELSAEKEKEIERLKGTYESLVGELKGEIEKGEIKITRAVDRLSVNMVDQILFDSGQSSVKTEGLKVLERVGAILKNVKDKQIRVVGHTDNVPITSKVKERFPTNWELSTARATNVVRYLQDTAGIEPKLLSAGGFSEYRPIDSNDTKEGRLKNRRIEILLLPLDLDSVIEELKQ